MAVVAVDMGGRSSISAGPSLLQVSEMKKKFCSTVNVVRWPSRVCCRREDLLQLHKDIVERRISMAPAGKKNHARSPLRDIRCVVACGMLLLSRSAAEPAQPSWVERTE